MKKLLFFASDYKIGLSQLLTDQLKSLHAASIDYVAVAGENEQEPGLTESLKQCGVALRRVQGLDCHSDFKRLANTVAGIIDSECIDVVHVQNNWQLALVSVAKRKARRKRVEIAYTLHAFRHNSPVKSVIAQMVIGSTLLLLADHVICMTDYLRRKFRLLSYKIKLLPLGISDEYFVDCYNAPSTDCLRLVFPAQFRHGKNQDMIIRAFADYVAKTSDRQSRLSLPGNGPLLDAMKQIAKQLDVDSQIEFPGFLSKAQVKAAYLESNVAIVASNSETFGQSIVEPYVLGRCVVSTPVGIAPEIIASGKNGYLFSTGQQLTRLLLQINDNRTQLVEIGKNNYEARKAFTWSSVTERYKQLILS